MLDTSTLICKDVHFKIVRTTIVLVSITISIYLLVTSSNNLQDIKRYTSTLHCVTHNPKINALPRAY